MKKQLLIGVLISAGCLYFALRGIPLRSVGHLLSQADARWIAAAVLLSCISYFGRVWRWKILMNPIKRVPAQVLAAPLIIGFFANNILPFRMGEFIRAHISGRKIHISRTASLGTIFIERIFDTLSFLSTFLCAAIFYPFPTFVERGAYMLGAACLAAIAVLWIITTHRTRFEALVHRFGLPHAWALKIESTVNNFAHGVSGLRHTRSNIEAMLLSLGIWFLEGLFLWLMAHAFHLVIPLPGAFFLLFFLGLSVTIPQAPGYVGTMELFGVTALGILKIPKEEGLSLILAVHATQFLFVGAIGLWALHHEGLSIGKLMNSGEKE
jgi:uncharacterized protein (TIRG00374 family)